MTLLQELRPRLAEYEAEAKEVRERLQAIESLASHARALIAEEERRLGQQPPVQEPKEPTSGNARRPTVPMMVRDVLPTNKPMRFNELRNLILAVWFQGEDPIWVGKQVGSALGRAVERGTVRKISRGLYIQIPADTAEEVPTPQKKSQAAYRTLCG